jgi:hypothetical protein
MSKEIAEQMREESWARLRTFDDLTVQYLPNDRPRELANSYLALHERAEWLAIELSAAHELLVQVRAHLDGSERLRLAVERALEAS